MQASRISLTDISRSEETPSSKEQSSIVDAKRRDIWYAATSAWQSTANMGPFKIEMIRAHIVVGMTNSSLSLKLQLGTTLTLKNAIDAARQSEAAKREQAMM